MLKKTIIPLHLYIFHGEIFVTQCKIQKRRNNIYGTLKFISYQIVLYVYIYTYCPLQCHQQSFLPSLGLIKEKKKIIVPYQFSSVFYLSESFVDMKHSFLFVWLRQLESIYDLERNFSVRLTDDEYLPFVNKTVHYFTVWSQKSFHYVKTDDFQDLGPWFTMRPFCMDESKSGRREHGFSDNETFQSRLI